VVVVVVVVVEGVVVGSIRCDDISIHRKRTM